MHCYSRPLHDTVLAHWSLIQALAGQLLHVYKVTVAQLIRTSAAGFLVFFSYYRDSTINSWYSHIRITFMF